MITRFANITSRLALALAILFTFAACGGGGGGGGGGDNGFLGNNGGDEEVYFLLLELFDPEGNPTSSVTSTRPATVRARVTQNGRNGRAVPDVVVSATADVGVLEPESGSALTDEDGVAELQIVADGVLGAGTVEVTVESPSGPVTETISYQIGFADLQLGYYAGESFIPNEIGVNASSLPAGGSAALTVNIVDEVGEPVTTTEEIQFSSGCARSGLATIEPNPSIATNGLATATYTTTGCSGTDTITASVSGGDSSAMVTLDIAAPTAGSIQFVAAEPQLIALKGTGGPGRQENSAVSFQVVNGSGSPISGVPVDFTLTTNLGGISLSSNTVTSGTDGTVSTTVRAGNVATAVRVTATIEAEDETGSPIQLSTVSDELVVSTGLPDQNSISLSASSLSVPGALDRDGETATLTVRMADKFNNPVPDGTAATFTTEYGSIEPSCLTEGGACSVTWTSQEPRRPSLGDEDIKTIFDQPYSCPSHRGNSGPCPDVIATSGSTSAAISTVTVTAIGEEFFTDRNGNGVFDQEEADDELFVNLPEAFNDYNDDGVYTPAGGGECPLPLSLDTCSASGFEETFVDFNNNMAYDLNDDPALYNGVLCPVEGDGVWCSRELVNVRDDIRLLLTSSASNSYYFLLTRSGSVRDSVFETSNYIVYISDLFNNPPAGGDTVTVSSSGDCSILTETSFIAPDVNSQGAFAIPLAVEGDGNGENDNSEETGTVTIKVNSGGGTSERTYPCFTEGEPPVVDPDEDDDGLVVSGGG